MAYNKRDKKSNRKKLQNKARQKFFEKANIAKKQYYQKLKELEQEKNQFDENQ